MRDVSKVFNLLHVVQETVSDCAGTNLTDLPDLSGLTKVLELELKSRPRQRMTHFMLAQLLQMTQLQALSITGRIQSAFMPFNALYNLPCLRRLTYWDYDDAAAPGEVPSGLVHSHR